MIEGNGAPTSKTPGFKGQLYRDLKTDKFYECTGVDVARDQQAFVSTTDYVTSENTYSWERHTGMTPITDLSYYCYEGARLENLPDLDTRNVVNFRFMFNNCTSLTSVPTLDTSNGTDFGYMFNGCKALTSVPELDTSKGTNFTNMFMNCESLTSVPALDTSNGTKLGGMFNGCKALTSVPELDTRNGVYFSSMFDSCESLTSVPALDTSNGTEFYSMFNRCKALTSVPELDTSKGTNLYSMFNSCESLESVPKLDVGNASTVGYSGGVNSIFYNCKKLTNLRLYNIRLSIQIGSGDTYGHLLDVDSLVHTIKELCKVSTQQTLTMGDTNLNKIANLYCKVLDDTTEKIEMELCESTEEGAMTLSAYATLKNWRFQ